MAKQRKINKCPLHGDRLQYEPTAWGSRGQCPEEGCTIVHWQGSTSTPADYETRQLRRECHARFDPLWKTNAPQFNQGHRPNNPQVRRSRAYRWLAESMGLKMKETHFGMFDADQCREALAHLDVLTKPATTTESR